jgi:hypothetical protein
MRSGLLVVLALTVSACALAGSRSALIDLTSVTMVDSGDGTIDGDSFTVTEHSPRPAPPMRAEILRLDRTRYRPLDPIVYDVKITNISSQHLLLPISPLSIARRDRPASGYRSMLFTLLLVTSEGRELRVATFGVYGAPTKSRTLRTLDAGDSVTFRIPATLHVGDSITQTETSLQMPASVRAEAEVFTSVYSDRQTAVFQPPVTSAPFKIPLELVNPATVPLAPYGDPPVLSSISPRQASPGTSIRLAGLRFGVDRPPGPTVTFISASGDIVRRVPSGSTAYETNRSSGTQWMSVRVPGDLPAGTWNVVLDREGQRTAPFPLEVTEWVAPIVERLTRTTVNPGTFLEVIGRNFREGDRYELTDARGVLHSWASAISAFDVPLNCAPGTATLRITAKGPSGDVVSPSLTMAVTTTPLPLDWIVMNMRSVAPGQWTRLALHSRPAEDWWERIHVEFSQSGQTRVVALRPTDEERLQVPPDLAAGAVMLRGRVVHGSDASPWSEPHRYVIAQRPVPPTFDVIDVGATQQSVYLTAGPDKPTEFRAEPGDRLRIGGDFPMSRDTTVTVTFENAGTKRRVTATRDSTGKLAVDAPRDLAGGVWKIVVSVTGLPSVELPIVMRVRRVPPSGVLRPLHGGSHASRPSTNG